VRLYASVGAALIATREAAAWSRIAPSTTSGSRAGGLNLVVAAIVLWNTGYLERAVETLRASGTVVPDELLQHLSPLAWEHIVLTGDYRWGSDETRRSGQRRDLRVAR